jgi:putative spermidine/putrescine transport system substrate-binding protein
MPDAIDVSPAKAQEAIDQGMLAPFTPSTAGEIPDNLKDPDGHWVAAYYGIMALGTNTTIVPNAPKTFADLAKPEYEGMVALNGDPRTSGSAFAAVMAASLANGGSADDIMPGIQFFADLKASGNLIPTSVDQSTVISGETPIAIDWSYNWPGLRSQIEEAGYTVEINFPSDGVYGGYYSQGVVANSPHPECGQLWIEHIVSNEGALGYLEGGAMPARFAALEAAGAIDDAMLAELPPADLLAQVSFLTQDQITAATAALEENWGPMVADA